MAAPSAFTARVAFSPSAITVAGASAAPTLARAALAASTTAVEVTVAPARASMFSPRAKGAALPMNWPMKASSSAQRVPKPGVSSPEAIIMEAMAPFSTVRVTVTSLWNPLAVPV